MQRACEAALDVGQHLIRRRRLGVPQSPRDVFRLLAAGGLIDTPLADVLQRMVGFRNIAVHDYQALQLPTRWQSSATIRTISWRFPVRSCRTRPRSSGNRACVSLADRT